MKKETNLVSSGVPERKKFRCRLDLFFLRRFDQIGAGEEKIRRPTRPLAQSAEIPRVYSMYVLLLQID